ncbi:MAG: lipid-A-disaccharide synthase [Alphaproteobacteria bacterium]|jgi:lipid-A-disaccharide synthase|nr:lipid-A-disaccharide synthase [Alphaproteobacteria bacterium]
MTPAAANANAPLLFLIAGEPSGDMLGARLMAALKAATAGRARFAGVGGERMIAEGLDSQFPMADLAIMGLVEVVPRLPLLIRRIRQTVRAIRTTRPDAVITIDAPGFCFRVARRLAGAGIPLIHYVAPTVWAWRPGRAKRIARFLDHLMVLLPFEPPYFEAVGLACSFVGHPAVEEGRAGDGPAFRADHGIAAEAPLIAVLPGSRHSEVTRLLAPFGAAVAILADRFPGLRIVTLTVDTVAEAVAAATAQWRVPVTLLRDAGERADALAAADAALAASGTVTLELAAARTPMVVAYRMAPLTMAIARALVRVPYANLINLTLGREAIPELIQEDCRPRPLAETVAELVVDHEARAAQIAAIDKAMATLGQGVEQPSARAAKVVLEVIAGHGAPPEPQGDIPTDER